MAMKESLTLPEGVITVDPGEKSSAEIAFGLISEGKPVIVAGVGQADARRKVWIFQATVDPENNMLRDYKGWQYMDGTTFGHVDTKAGVHGDDIDYPDHVYFVAEVDESMLKRTADEDAVIAAINYALSYTPASSGFTPSF